MGRVPVSLENARRSTFSPIDFIRKRVLTPTTVHMRNRFSRHPSYTGFFYWAVATQLMLGNVVSIVGFVYVLAKFFEARIIGEFEAPYVLSWTSPGGGP